MRLVIYSPAFLPLVGGLEINTATLATELVKLGQEVVVVTQTPAGAAPDGDELPYEVVRRPGPLELLRRVRWCDLFLQQNVSLRGLWPLLLVRRPWAVSHHSWYCRTDGRIAWQDRLKRRLLRRAAVSIAVSRAVAADLATPSVVIGNPYRDALFRRLPEVERSRELAFVGRLVSDKGVDLLLEAMGRLARGGLHPRLTVVGDGPEAPCLCEQAERLGIGSQVDLVGTRTGEELVELLNRHRILVVPSRYDEPFGIVALEGIACGCLVVGSRGGGLGDAIGPHGFTFANGDVAGLTELLAGLLADSEAGTEKLAGAEAHLARHRAAAVAAAYLAALAGAVRS
jgi:glycosyltransferase involved in cell wall biosynthesis